MPQTRGLCIRTTQVHDWCYKNSSTALTFTDLTFPAAMATVAGIECDVVNLTCAVLARSQPVGDVTVVTLRKQATLDLTFVDAAGNPVPVTAGGLTVNTQTRTRFWDEFVKIAAPESAEITCELTDAGCRTTLNRDSVTVELFDIQSIAAEEAVRVQMETSEPLQPTKARKAHRPYLPGTGHV